MKLISWRFVLFLAVDGYSRMPIVAKIAANNRADTWLKFLTPALKRVIPQRTRSDYGSENMEIARLMSELYPNARRPHIFGRSVHNVLVERANGEFNRAVMRVFAALFLLMEREHGLDRDDELHLAALHIVFVPRIQKRLDDF